MTPDRTSLTADEMDTVVHEALHAAVAWVLLGRRGVRSISRLPDGPHSGMTRIDTEDARPFELACVKLAPFVDGMNRGVEGDWRDAWACAEMAYENRPDPENRGEDWGEEWMRGVVERTRELLGDSRVHKLRAAVEGALIAHPVMDAFEVSAVLQAADH